MAYLGFGVWSLAVQLISAVVFKTALLWYFSDWRPTRQFSFQSLRSLFGFGSNILFSSLLENIYQSAFSWIINKRFSIQSLGFYTQAKKLQEIPVLILSNVIGGVTFPAMVPTVITRFDCFCTVASNRMRLWSMPLGTTSRRPFIPFT